MSEDTVLTLLQIHEKPKGKSYLEYQAEISFKAGIKEVVEVVEEIFIHTVAKSFSGRKIQLDQWEQNKREWGLIPTKVRRIEMDKEMSSAHRVVSHTPAGRPNGTGIRLKVVDKNTGEQANYGYGVQFNNTTSEIEALPNLRVTVEGWDAREVVTKELYEALKELINFLTHDGLDTNNRLLPFIDKGIKVLASAKR